MSSPVTDPVSPSWAAAYSHSASDVILLHLAPLVTLVYIEPIRQLRMKQMKSQV